VSIKPVIEGRPAEGFTVGAVTAQPATVDVVGPEGALGRLREATTEPISVTDATRSFRETVTVGVVDPWVRLQRPQATEVSIEIVPMDAEQTFPNVPVQVRNLATTLSATVQPATVTLNVRGATQALSTLTVEKIAAYVDATGLTSGRHTLDVQIELAAGVEVSATDPSRVTVIVRRR
jgi:YbbR domain-containing protein